MDDRFGSDDHMRSIGQTARLCELICQQRFYNDPVIGVDELDAILLRLDRHASAAEMIANRIRKAAAQLIERRR
jgi:hypothetical protein